MTKSLYVYRSNRVIKIKDGIDLDTLKESGYFDKHPDTIVCSSVPPQNATMEKWENRKHSNNKKNKRYY